MNLVWECEMWHWGNKSVRTPSWSLANEESFPSTFHWLIAGFYYWSEKKKKKGGPLCPWEGTFSMPLFPRFIKDRCLIWKCLIKTSDLIEWFFVPGYGYCAYHNVFVILPNLNSDTGCEAEKFFWDWNTVNSIRKLCIYLDIYDVGGFPRYHFDTTPHPNFQTGF